MLTGSQESPNGRIGGRESKHIRLGGSAARLGDVRQELGREGNETRALNVALHTFPLPHSAGLSSPGRESGNLDSSLQQELGEINGSVL